MCGFYGERWGKKFIDKRDWIKYNEELVVRGEFFTDYFKSYKSLKQFEKYSKINYQKIFGKGHDHTNGFEAFWSYAKEGFMKYHEINMKNCPLSKRDGI